jgi:hypothetical protein
MGNNITNTGNLMRNATANRIAAAEQMAVTPKAPKPIQKQPTRTAAPLPKPKQKFVDARQRAIDAAAAADRAAIIARNQKMSLRR